VKMLNPAMFAVALSIFLSTGTAQVRVRLDDGPSPLEGRLAVYYQNTWGTVCDDYFDDADAKVVCRMLGHAFGRFIHNQDNGYGRGSGPIWLDNVHCNGTETNIADCLHNGWRKNNCDHREDVSVSCISTVRLIGSLREGRLEVYYNGTWRTACDDHFDNTAAGVVCRSIGYKDGKQLSGNRYGASIRSIWLGNILCNGTEMAIEQCQHDSWGSRECTHDTFISISCFTEVRLVGNSGSKGRLEVYHNGAWGTVCDSGFTDAAARVACYSLGYGHTEYGRSGQFVNNQYGAGSGRIWLNNVQCHGSELHITECPHNGWGRHNCSHSDDVSVSCIADSAEAVALVGAGNPRVGRLEVFHANQWGTVCDDGFTDAAARVVCFSLGFGYVGRKVDINHYGVGDGMIWLNNVNCTGTEWYIGECSHHDWGTHNCSHQQDVAVSCYSTPITPVRLVGGSDSTGRLEVFHNAVWGTVCEDFFTAATASVICRMLGFLSGAKIDNRNYTIIHGKIWLDNVECNGTETDISECSHNDWGFHNCQHREDVAVSCSRIDIRLNGGRDPREGRLEVLYNGTWGSVCRNELNDAAARIVCNTLGLGYIGRSVRNNYGLGPGQTWLNSFRCNGMEKNIAECRHDAWGVSGCSSSEYKAVSCLPDNAVALFGGGSPREGRLEMYHNGTWGTVCDDGFTDTAARVVCYSLGFGHVGQEMNIDKYGIGKGHIWLDDIRCSGMERHISRCSNKGWGVHNCLHHEDVAVSCTGESSGTSTKSSSPKSILSSTRSVLFTTSFSTSTPSTSSELSTSSLTSSSVSSSSQLLKSSSTSSFQGGSNNSQSTADITQIIIVAIVVGGLLLITCVIVIGLVVRLRQKTHQQERTEVAMIPMHATTSSTSSNNAAFENPAYSNNHYNYSQEPSAPVVGVVGGIGRGGSYRDNEKLLDDQL